MAFIKNRILCVPKEDGTGYEEFCTVNNQIFLTADIAEDEFIYQEFVNAVMYPLSMKVEQVYLLNSDETTYMDISEYMIGGNLSFQYQQGETRNGNIELFNKDNMFIPDPLCGIIWTGKKLRINSGLYYNGTVFWRKCGIYCMKSPKIDSQKNTVSFDIYDKFAMLDGTIGGKRDNVFKISVGTDIKQAVKLCLEETDYNGQPYDDKPIFFPDNIKDITEQKTPYTINKSGGSMGDIILELAKIISCDTAYNDGGRLTLTPNSDLIDMDEHPVMWDFKNLGQTYTYPTYDYDYSSVPNVVYVTGAIENGKQYKGKYENRNPKSKNNLLISVPNVLYIEDSNIIGDKLCQDRAEYEWRAASRANLKLSFQTVFNPYLSPNDVFFWTDKDMKLKNEKFVVNSMSFDLINGAMMSVTASNMSEVSR